MSRRDRSENASFLGLGRQLQRGFGDLGRECLGVAYQLGFLVGLLLEVLGQYFAGRSRRAFGQTLRDQVVVRITGAYVHDVVCIAQLVYVLDQNDFHSVSSGLDYLNMSVTKGSMAK